MEQRPVGKKSVQEGCRKEQRAVGWQSELEGSLARQAQVNTDGKKAGKRGRMDTTQQMKQIDGSRVQQEEGCTVYVEARYGTEKARTST